MLIKLSGIQIVTATADAIVIIGRKKPKGKRKQEKSLTATGKNDAKTP